MSIILYNFTFHIGIYRGLCCPHFPAASASLHSIGLFSSRGPSGSMRPGSTPRLFPFRPSCRAAFGGPRPMSRPGVRRRCGPPGRAFLLSGLKIGRLRDVLHTNFFLNHRGRRVRFYAFAGVEPRPAVRCVLNRWRGAVEPRPPVWPAPVLRCVGIWARAFGIASPSLATYVNGGNASRSSVRCGYSAPQPPKNFKRIWAAGQAK